MAFRVVGARIWLLTARLTNASGSSWPSPQVSITFMRFILNRRGNWLALLVPQRLLLKLLGCVTLSERYVGRTGNFCTRPLPRLPLIAPF